MKREQLVVNTIAFHDQWQSGTGQAEFLEPIRQLGIQQVEVRREYFRDEADYDWTAKIAQRLDLQLWYSVPAQLFCDGQPDLRLFDVVLEEAVRLGVSAIKLNRGDYRGWTKDAAQAVRDRIEQYGGLVTVENDQTSHDGSLSPLVSFLEDCRSADVPVFATFDIGNWYWVGEDGLAAARQLHGFTRYIHLKDAQFQPALTAAALGEGSLPVRDMLAMLPNHVPAALEYPCGDQPLPRLEAGIKWLESLGTASIAPEGGGSASGH